MKSKVERRTAQTKEEAIDEYIDWIFKKCLHGNYNKSVDECPSCRSAFDHVMMYREERFGS